MFEVGFSELMVIAVVALIVIGPERLPTVARTIGHLLGRLQRYVSDVKADINREMQLEEFKKLQQQMAQQMNEVKSTVTQEMNSVQSSLTGTLSEADAALKSVTDPANAGVTQVSNDAAPTNASPVESKSV